MRHLPILAATAALLACPAAAQTPDAAPMPPVPMQDSPPPQPPLKAPPATLTDADTACRRGDRPACAEAGRIREKVLSGMPSAPVSAAGGGSPKGPR